MKRLSFLAVSFFMLTFSVRSQSLGNYPSASISVGGNTTVTPIAIPANTSKITVSASLGFSGLLTAKPATGVVSITDAKPVGNFTITVKAFSSSGSSVTKTFPLTISKPACSQGTFIGNSQIAAGPNQNNIAIGDFNGDGRQDLAFAHEGFNSISIRLGDGHGGFTGNTEIGVASHPYSLAVGDFDGDGKQDIATTNQGGDNVSILIGNGSGGFSVNATIGVDIGPVSIAVGDFNNDGKQDLAVANFNASNFSILLGNGNGGFGSSQFHSVSSYPSYIVVGDFNNDGNQDIATASQANDRISIRLGNGSGGFSGNTEVPVGMDPYSLAAGDFNNDGKLDLASANYLSNTVSIRLGNGLGQFTGTTDVPVGLNPYHVALGNFNGDDYLDFATANYFDNNVSIRYGDGLGGFSGTTSVPAGSYPLCVVVGDFNNDGFQELAVANYFDQTVSIRLGLAGSPPAINSFVNGPNCDGLDLHLHSSGGNTYSWSGPNGFTSAYQNPVLQSATVNNTGSYTVTVSTADNCTGSASTYVNVHSLPVVTFAVPTDTLCEYDPSLALTGYPIGGNFYGPGISGNIFDPAVAGPGLYQLNYTYTDPNGCTDSMLDKMYVLVCAGINDISNNNEIKIYPNPVKDKLIIDLTGMKGIYSASLFSPDGNQIREWIFSHDEIQVISMNGIANGVYFIKLFSCDATFVMKVVKEE